MVCNEVAYDGTAHYVCTSERYTVHTHADYSPSMVLLPEDATVALDDMDCLWLIEVDVICHCYRHQGHGLVSEHVGRED